MFNSKHLAEYLANYLDPYDWADLESDFYGQRQFIVVDKEKLKEELLSILNRYTPPEITIK